MMYNLIYNIYLPCGRYKVSTKDHVVASGDEIYFARYYSYDRVNMLTWSHFVKICNYIITTDYNDKFWSKCNAWGNASKLSHFMLT